MVVGTADCGNFVNWCLVDFRRKFCSRGIYLYPILIAAMPLTRDKINSTLLAIVTGFIVLYLIFDREWMLYVSAVVGIGGLLSTTFGGLIHRLWMGLAKGLGFINGHLLLGLIFFFLLFPISLLYRLKSSDPLQLKKGKDSYFKDRNHTFEKKDLENPW